MKNPLTYVLILVVLGCGVWMFYWNSSAPAPTEVAPHVAAVACTSCGKAWVQQVGRQPVPCKFCNQNTGWIAAKCSKCKKVFAMVEESPGKPKSECPKCGPTQLLELEPEDLTKSP